MPDQAVIHIIDDDDAIRDSLTFLLETSGFAARAYESAEQFLEARMDAAPGCILTDVRMPEMSGLDLVRRLNEVGSTLPVVMMTGHADVPLAVEAMKAGVIDFIEKPFDDETLLESLRTALREDRRPMAVDPRRAATIERFEALSARERQVLEGLVAGRPNKVIAYDLGISPRTVEVYRANVMTKTRAGSLSELVRMALSAGLEI
jgi:two-component system response regulator FixJ